jgi:hypothetical protein
MTLYERSTEARRINTFKTGGFDMKLYKITRLADEVNYDETSGVIIAEKSEESALSQVPDSFWLDGRDSKVTLEVTLIGTAVKGIKAGTILLTDFKAG